MEGNRLFFKQLYIHIMSRLNLVTCNVRGLQNDAKRRETFHYFHIKNFDIIFLQETHSTVKNETVWSAQWGSKIRFAHRSSSAGGTAILINKKLDMTVHNIIAHDAGRYVLMYVTYNKAKILLANIYAPNSDSPEFFQEVFGIIQKFSPDYYWIGGDFNLALDVKVDRLGSTTNNDRSAQWLYTHLLNNELVDVWRHFNPSTAGFTWQKSNPRKIFSRLDYIVMSEVFLQFVREVKLIPGFRSDHSWVVVTIEFDYVKKGPGYWKFNTQLLKDKEYVEKINMLIDIELELNTDKSKRERWELLKLAVRGSTLQYASRKHKSRRLELEVLERKLNQVKAENCVSYGTLKNKEEQIRKIKADIETLMKIKTYGAALRSRSNWAIHGEKPTKYFLNSEKHNFYKKTLYKVQDDSGKIYSQPKQVLNQIKAFYKKLYTATDEYNEEYPDKLTLPKITQVQHESCEQPITQEEIGLALAQLQNNKCSGTDGIPPDFYKVFWTKIKKLMYEMYQETVEHGKFHVSARRGILSLLEKKGKSAIKIGSWRPLSILNADNKVYSKMLANRLKTVQPHLIHHTQTGFLQGRYLSENILKICEVMQYCQIKNIEAVLISFDFAKAFDTVNWCAIRKAFQLSNFGENFINMMEVLFNDPLICASNNGYWSDFFTPTRGCRQGCCFSPLAFTQTVEILGAAIRQNTKIKGIKLGKEEIKAGQYADDLWATLIANSGNINEMLTEIDRFGEFSGLKLNAEKTQVLRIGSLRDSVAEFYTIRKLYWSPGPVTILGVKLHPNELIMQSVNFYDTLEKVQDILNAWNYRDLTLIGRITVVNTLISTLFIHKLLALPTPSADFFKKYKKIVVNFLWKGKQPRIKYADLTQDYNKLGLKLVDLEIKNWALKAAWPVRWKNRELTELSWFFTTLPINDARIWHTNTDFVEVEKFHMASTVSAAPSIWAAWCRFHYQETLADYEDIISTIVWGNSLIKVNNRPVYNRNLVNSNLETIFDIVDVRNKQFYTYREITEIFGPVFDPLIYFGIITAIPSAWKNIIFNNQLQDEIEIDPSEKTFITFKNLSPSKAIYWDLIKKFVPTNQVLCTMWQAELNYVVTEDEWFTLFIDFQKQIKPVKLRNFQYRLLRRILTTNVRRAKWDNNVSDLCTFCEQEKETVLHILVECIEVQPLWKALTKLVKYYFNTVITFTPQLIILNNYKGTSKIMINLLIIIMKQYIYATKCANEKLNFVMYMNRINYWYQIDKWHQTQLGYQDHMLTKKWKTLF